MNRRYEILKIGIFIFLLSMFLLIYSLPKKISAGNKTDKKVENPHLLRADSKVLKIAIPKFENSLNPFYDGKNEVSVLSKLIYSSIITKDKNNNVVLDAASDYWYEDQGRTIAVVLKKDIKFSDGSNLDAYDVEKVYKILADPSYDGLHSSYVEKLKGYYDYKVGQNKDSLGVEAVDRYLLRFRFEIADYNNINALSFPLVNTSNMEYNYGEASQIAKLEFKAGSGPYRVESKEDGQINLTLNDSVVYSDYSIKNIQIFEYDYFYALSEYKKGNIDIVYKYDKNLAIENLIDDRTLEYSKLIDNQASNYYVLGFNSDSNLFSKAEYRRALRNSIDFPDIVNRAYGQDIFSFPLLPIFENSWFNNKSLKDNSKIELEDLLSEDYEKRDGFYVDEKGNDLSVSMVVSENNEFVKKIEENLIEAFKKQSIRLEITYLQDKEMFEAFNGKAKFDMFVSNRMMTEIPSIRNDYAYDVEKGIYMGLPTDGILYVMGLIADSTQNKYVQDFAKNWQNNFIKNTPYIVMATSNLTSIINSRIEGLYLNEFVGIDNIYNLKNLKIKQN